MQTLKAIPGVAIANHFGDGRMLRMVDGEVEGIDLRTAVCIHVRVRVVT